MAQRKSSKAKLIALPPPVTIPPNLNDIELRLLRVFCAVVEAGGFSAAQSELNIRQSTISTHMGELEARLNVRLCRRGRSGFALTQHGEAVYDACQALFAALDDFRARVGEVRNRIVGSLNIGMLDNTITDPNNRLSAAIANLKKTGPLVQIHLVVTSPSEIARAIIDKIGRAHV
jgi:DNA-binding transcriptional LysR family regulator